MLDYCAEEIPKIFPNEVKETYYIPYAPKSPHHNIKQAAKGKLWSRFVNVRNALRTAENTNKAANKENVPLKNYLNKQVELEILNTLIEPKEKVLELWAETYQQRKTILRASSLTVQEIFDRYAALSTSLGPDLRSVTQLKRLWDKLKRSRKNILAEERRELMATGGGPPKPPASPQPEIDNLIPHLNYEINVEDDSDGINLKNNAQVIQEATPGPSSASEVRPVTSTQTPKKPTVYKQNDCLNELKKRDCN
ncbi:hypothetical protein RN001_001585 [Aquatica leii]|uniref:Regulatory protein zeste n=1 Tax=Aquatica leii TaxID=1421715 RepID=A0AAN7SLB8_9COLE|nr:hypothetical protein RN001_001585 [Aquatica leii]